MMDHDGISLLTMWVNQVVPIEIRLSYFPGTAHDSMYMVMIEYAGEEPYCLGLYPSFIFAMWAVTAWLSGEVDEGV